MKSLSETSGFVKTVMAEFRIVGDLKKAFWNIQFLYKELFKCFRFDSYEQFLKSIS